MITSPFPPEAEEGRHDEALVRRVRFPALLILSLSVLLTACSGGVSSKKSPVSADLGARTLSGFVGSPSLADATVTLFQDGGASTLSALSGDQASYSITLDKSVSLPIRIQVEGGTDLLTGQPNDDVLSALSFDPNARSVSVSHLTSLAAAMAECQGSATAASLDSAWQRLNGRMGLTTAPDQANLDSRELAGQMRANLILQESVARTRQALAAVDPQSSETIMDALACDLADDARLNLSSPASDPRLTGIFRAAEAAVILEFMADAPYVGGEPALTAIDAVLRQVSGDAQAGMATLPVPAPLIASAERHLALLRVEFPDAALIELLLSLFAGDPEAAVTEALSAARLNALWRLPEQVALTDESTLARFADSAAAQTRATAPMISLSADPTSIQTGETTRLSWAASDADVCRADGAWNGDRATTGAESSAPLNASAEFRLVCIGLAGLAEAAAQVSVLDGNARPMVSLSADRPVLTAGESTRLRWTSSNATACSASGAWSGTRPVVGSQLTGNLSRTSDYTLTCTGPGGSDSATLRVTVNAAPTPTPVPTPDPEPTPAPTPQPVPTVSLSSSSSLVNAGGSVTLSWSASNASQCTASGGWSGSRSTSGSAVVGPIGQQTTFSLSCSGPGGSSLDMVSVRVNGSMSLNWVAPTENVDGTPLTDLAGYRVYYGTSSRDYSSSTAVTNPSATSVSIRAPSGDYFVAMTALDGEGNESAYSNEVRKTVP